MNSEKCTTKHLKAGLGSLAWLVPSVIAFWFRVQGSKIRVSGLESRVKGTQGTVPPHPMCLVGREASERGFSLKCGRHLEKSI